MPWRDVSPETLIISRFNGTCTPSKFAYVATCQPVASDDKPFVQCMNLVTDHDDDNNKIPPGVLSVLHRLWYELHAVALSETKSRPDRTDESQPRKLPLPERDSRRRAQQAAVPGLVLEKQLEPSHALVDLWYTMTEEDMPCYVEPSHCKCREDELRGVKVESFLKLDNSGRVQKIQRDIHVEADLSNEYRLELAFQCRSLALDQLQLIDYAKSEEMYDYWYGLLMQSPPENFMPNTVKQLLIADRQIWLLAAGTCREGISIRPDGSKPLEKAFAKALLDPMIRATLQPLPKARSHNDSKYNHKLENKRHEKERPPPYWKGAKDGKGGKSGKGGKGLLLLCQALLEIAMSGRIAVAWIALPCGTCSGAREIQLPFQKSLPQPLQSQEFPRGLPQLPPSCQDRGNKANMIYDNMMVITPCLIKHDLFVVIENPSRSWLWSIHCCARLLLQSFVNIELQHCKWSGSEPSRNKWTHLRTNLTCLSELQGPCKAAHHHLSWGKTSSGYATADEAEHPVPMCKAMASCITAFMNPESPPPGATPLLQHVSPHKLRRLTAGRQPRGKKLPQLLPEFETVLTLPDSALSNEWHRELRHCFSRGAEGSEKDNLERYRVVGVWRDPRAYIESASDLVHPVDFVESLPTVSQEAIIHTLSFTPGKLVFSMIPEIRALTKLVHDNSEADQSYFNSLPDTANKVLHDKKLATMQLWLERSSEEWPDQDLFKDIASSFSITGIHPYSGVFDQEPSLPTMSVADLRQTSTMNNTDFISRTSSSSDPELDKEAWLKTQEEEEDSLMCLHQCNFTYIHGRVRMRCGKRCSGKYQHEGDRHMCAEHQIVDDDDLDSRQKASGGGVPHISRRFPIKQSGEVRLIYDLLEFNIPATFGCEDKLTLLDVDSITSLIRLVESALVGESLILQKLGNLVVHKSWTERQWMGTTVDPKSAYEQLYVKPSDQWASCGAAYNPAKETNELYIPISLPSGSAASVISLNRVSRFLWFSGCKTLGLLWANFCDGFPIITSAICSTPVLAASQLFLELSRWSIAKGEKQKDFASLFTALGVTLNVERMPEALAEVHNSERRVADMLQSMQEVLTANRMTCKHSEVFRGRLQFIESNNPGKVGKSIYTSLFKHDLKCKPELPEKERLLFAKLVEWLNTSAPRKISPLPQLRPVLISSDGACEQSGKAIPLTTCGALLIHPEEDCREVFGFTVADELIPSWMTADQHQVVTEAELFAAATAVDTWKHLLENRRVLFYFIDSEPAMFSLIRGTSNVDSCSCIISMCHNIAEKHKTFIWFVRIPSKSNPSDMPARLLVEQAAKEYSATVVIANQSIPNES